MLTELLIGASDYREFFDHLMAGFGLKNTLYSDAEFSDQFVLWSFSLKESV